MTPPSLPPLSTRPGEAPALAILASDADTEAKARACQQLAVTGGPKAVPALAALLGDGKLSSHARSGLENIKDPSAGEALLKALSGLQGELLAAAVTSLGVRRETRAVAELQKLVADPKRGAALPAVAALGQIANDEALDTIRKLLTGGPADLRIPAAHAALAAADQLNKDGKTAASTGLRDAVSSADLPAHIRDAAKVR